MLVSSKVPYYAYLLYLIMCNRRSDTYDIEVYTAHHSPSSIRVVGEVLYPKSLVNLHVYFPTSPF